MNHNGTDSPLAGGNNEKIKTRVLLGAVALNNKKEELTMEKKYEFYPIDDVDETGITQKHSAYLEDCLKLKELSQYLDEFEINILEKDCHQYEYGLSVLLPESKAWSWTEWQDTESVVEKLQKKYNNFFDGKTSTSGFMYGTHSLYYEVVLDILKGYFVDGDDTVMLFMSFSQEKDLVLFIARLLYPFGYESYLLKLFVKVSERIIAYEKKKIRMNYLC